MTRSNILLNELRSWGKGAQPKKEDPLLNQEPSKEGDDLIIWGDKAEFVPPQHYSKVAKATLSWPSIIVDIVHVRHRDYRLVVWFAKDSLARAIVKYNGVDLCEVAVVWNEESQTLTDLFNWFELKMPEFVYRAVGKKPTVVRLVPRDLIKQMVEWQ